MCKLSIVVVNWNAGSQLRDCVTSILNSNQSCFKLENIVIVDNASTDDSLSLLPQDERIIVVRNKANYGFGKACNIGANLAINSDLLLFLNPDTELNSETLYSAVEFFLDNNKIFNFEILGIKLTHKNGSVQRSCARFPNATSYFFDTIGLSKLFPNQSLHMDDFDHQSSMFVDHVIGAFFLMKNKIFQELDGFDENYFVYLEDLDFSYRARKLGYKSYFLAETSAMHVGGGCSQQVKATRLFYSLNSRLIYAKKHFSALDYLLVSGLTLFVEPFSRAMLSLLKRDFKGFSETLLSYKMLYKGLLNK